MTDATQSRSRKSARNLSDASVTFGLAAVLLFFVVSGCISYWNTRTLSRNAELVAHTHEVIIGLNEILGLMKDAETGQRGFVITGNENYLAPYNNALGEIESEMVELKRLTADNPDQQTRLDAMHIHIANKLNELHETIELRRSQGFDAAKAVVVTDRGKNEMDAIRNIIITMQHEEDELRTRRIQETADAYRTAIASVLFAALLGAVMAMIVAALMKRAAVARERQQWLQSGQLGLADAVAGEKRVEAVGEEILSFLAKYFDAHAGAFFVQNGSEYRRIATYGVPSDNKMPMRFSRGEGLLGQAVQDERVIEVRDVPEHYLTVGSALGQATPRQLLIAPTTADNAVNGVIELGFLHPPHEDAVKLLEQVAEMTGIALRSANYRTELQNFLEETQRQAEELQAQGEELRVNNEELEEQSRALKESQLRLEQQQAELEQTNAQLEEQTRQLEIQRDDLERANKEVGRKAEEVEQASRYKSDFLANMSHELRTPLNSSLILAKLLGDNPEGNLTDEQVKFAQTIQSSGNDLLALINDILDLSKIEAGHMEVRPESVPLGRMLHDIGRVFEPMAAQKGLTFSTELDGDVTLETDRQRLEQILKNLISNAVKFTEKGSVTLQVRAQDKDIAFTVADTGIGIDPEKQQSIFDAFRQADGTISRKYGGTGLGLSISRELARLLGGYITLESEPGEGSSFTLTIPQRYDAAKAAKAPVKFAPAASGIKKSKSTEPAPVEAAPLPHRRIEDDRERLAGNQRMILVIEDDEPFARILYDLAHELDFQCLIATTAEEALLVARQYMPSAMVLDVGLPDHSGLSVLDRVKRDPRTRHIPVHVVSANDYAQTAYALGAIGYMLKPVKREQLADALRQMETRLSQRLRRVLIVEDDQVQRDSMRKLLGLQNVETIAVGTAADCLDKLKAMTFDCMVLDLSLPDATGYNLLETLSRDEAYGFPPVIVYTGRDLSADEEQRLRRYSKSIIIKGAKSPERLLDEVTLFLHQVVSELPPEQQRMIEKARNRDAMLEGRHILVVEDDVRNVYALTSIFEPRGALVQIARNGKEALSALDRSREKGGHAIDLVLMDVMMPEMDGLTATRAIRMNPEFKKLPIIMLTAKAMKDDQERCLAAGANDYMAKPLDVEKLLSLVRVWMPR